MLVWTDGRMIDRGLIQHHRIGYLSELQMKPIKDEAQQGKRRQPGHSYNEPSQTAGGRRRRTS